MQVQPTIRILSEKKLIGKQLTMSFAKNTTGELWKSFLPRRNEIGNSVGNELYSLQVYPANFFTDFDLQRPFVKWALKEVTSFDMIPNEMEFFVLPSGLYAIFHYQGLHTDDAIFRYIFYTWVPQSEYELDYSRPFFEILGEKYKNADPNSEEDICIPIRKK